MAVFKVLPTFVPPPQPTPQDVRTAVVGLMNQTVANMLSMYSRVYAITFDSPTEISPQAVMNAMGTDAGTLIAFLEQLRADLNRVQAGIIPALPPYTVNADNTVTLG